MVMWLDFIFLCLVVVSLFVLMVEVLKYLDELIYIVLIIILIEFLFCLIFE